MRKVDTIIYGDTVITANHDFDVLERHAVVIDQGKVVAILPSGTTALDHFNAGETYHLDNHVLMPGLINAHGHAPMTLFRGWADDFELMTWLNDYIWPAETAFVDGQFVADGTRLAAAEMIKSGTTCYSDMYFFPEVAAATASEAGLKVQITSPIFDFPCNWGTGPDDYLQKAQALQATYHDSEFVNIVFGPHAPYTVSDEPLTRIRELAEQLNTGVHMHLHETAHEVDTAVQDHQQRPVARMQQLGLLNERFQAVHMTTLNDDDIRMIADAGAHIIHCPESNLKLASGFTPVQKLLDAGINVALGTDGAASNNDLDMFGEIRTAAMLSKAVAGSATAVNAEQAIRMATINGAKAMGIDADTGSLEVGKCADMIALDLSGIEHQPIYDIVSHLVYTNVSHAVSHSWVNGKLLLNNRQLTTLRVDDVKQQALDWKQKIQDFKKQP